MKVTRYRRIKIYGYIGNGPNECDKISAVRKKGATKIDLFKVTRNGSYYI